MGAPSDRLTLAQAAQVMSERRGKQVSDETIRRLVEAGKIAAEAEPWPGGKRYVIERWELERYLLLEWLDRQMAADVVVRDGSSRPPAEDFPKYFRFGPDDGSNRLPQCEVIVSVVEFWRLAYGDAAEATTVLRARTGIAEGGFEVRFVLDQERTAKELLSLIRRVRPPTVFGLDRTALQHEALEHLLSKALPALRGATDPERYLLRSVRNFYRDKIRHAQRSREIPFEAAGDLAADDY